MILLCSFSMVLHNCLHNTGQVKFRKRIYLKSPLIKACMICRGDLRLSRWRGHSCCRTLTVVAAVEAVIWVYHWPGQMAGYWVAELLECLKQHHQSRYLMAIHYSLHSNFSVAFVGHIIYESYLIFITICTKWPIYPFGCST